MCHHVPMLHPMSPGYTMRGAGYDIRALLLLSLTITGLETTCSSKLRSWIGPTNFIEGSIPPRSGLGLVGIDKKIYLFGGYYEGVQLQVYSIKRFDWLLDSLLSCQVY